MPKTTFPGYVYLDLDHPMVAWECYRGTLILPPKSDSNEKRNISLFLTNIVYTNDNNRLANELLFEHIRSKFFPSTVSRLHCLYVFDDKESTRKAIFWGNHFRSENLVEVGVGASNITKTDANWITKPKRDKNGLSFISDIKKYWSGKPYNNNPQWEVLVDGYAILWGTDHRDKAYEIIKNNMPDSLGLLELSRIAEATGSYLGHISPQILRIGNSEFKLQYMLDVHDLNNQKNLTKIEAYIEKNQINHEDLRKLFNEQGVFRITPPDLRKYNKKFCLSHYNLYDYASLKIHTN